MHDAAGVEQLHSRSRSRPASHAYSRLVRCDVRVPCAACCAAGEAPPITAEDWDREFAKYRASPEFRRVNSRMTLAEFKFIYWMEYAHRMWGRALGLVFAVPALAFAARGRIRGPLASRLGLLFLMGGAQVRHTREPVTQHAHIHACNRFMHACGT